MVDEVIVGLDLMSKLGMNVQGIPHDDPDHKRREQEHEEALLLEENYERPLNPGNCGDLPLIDNAPTCPTCYQQHATDEVGTL